MNPYKRTRFCKETGWGNKYENKTRYDEGRFQFSRPFKQMLYPDLRPRFHSNPPPVNSNTHLFFSTYAIRLDAFLSDSFSLLAAFLEGSDRSFDSFKKIWVERQFSLIHITSNDRLLRERLMFFFFQMFFTFLYEGVNLKFPGIIISTFDLHIGVVFSLYMLYNTQSTCFPKYLIPVDTKQWKMLLEVYDGFCEENKVDGIYALGTLISEKSFVFLSFIDHRPFYYQQSRLEAGGYAPGLYASKLKGPSQDRLKSRTEIIHEQFDEVERSLIDSRYERFYDPEFCRELEELEKEYSSCKNNLENEFSAFGLNVPVVSTFTDRSFDNWISLQDNIEEEQIVAAYLTWIASTHYNYRNTILAKTTNPPGSCTPLDSQLYIQNEDAVITEGTSHSADLPANTISETTPGNNANQQSEVAAKDFEIFGSFLNDPNIDFNSANFAQILESLISQPRPEISDNNTQDQDLVTQDDNLDIESISP